MEMYKSNKFNKKIYNAICKFCKDKRVKEGLTQSEMAEIVGVTQSTISLFEAGKIDTGSILLRYILRYYKLEDK